MRPRIRVAKPVKMGQFRDELILAGVPVTVMSSGSRDPENGDGPYPDIVLRLPEEYREQVETVLDAHVPDLQYKSSAIDLVKQEAYQRIEQRYSTRQMITDLAEVVGILVKEMDKTALTAPKRETLLSFVKKSNKVAKVLADMKVIVASINALATDEEAAGLDILNNPNWSND